LRSGKPVRGPRFIASGQRLSADTCRHSSSQHDGRRAGIGPGQLAPPGLGARCLRGSGGP